MNRDSGTCFLLKSSPIGHYSIINNLHSLEIVSNQTEKLVIKFLTGNPSHINYTNHMKQQP